MKAHVQTGDEDNSDSMAVADAQRSVLCIFGSGTSLCQSTMSSAASAMLALLCKDKEQILAALRNLSAFRALASTL